MKLAVAFGASGSSRTSSATATPSTPSTTRSLRPVRGSLEVLTAARWRLVRRTLVLDLHRVQESPRRVTWSCVQITRMGGSCLEGRAGVTTDASQKREPDFKAGCACARE